MGKPLILAVIGLSFFFNLITLNLNRHRLESLEKSYSYIRNTQARNCATSGVYMALSKISLDEHWKEGFTNLTLNGGTDNVIIEDETTNGSLSRYERIIVSNARYEDAEKQVKVHVGIPPNLADLAVYTTGPTVEVDVEDETGVVDSLLALTNMPFMLPYDYEGLEAIAATEGYVFSGEFEPPDNWPNSSFYYSGTIPNVTKVMGDMTVLGGRTAWGIFVVYGNVILEGNARLEGCVVLPNPGSIVLNGGGDPKDSNITGGIFANGPVDGVGNHISVRYSSAFMTALAQFQMPMNLYIISWIESPSI